VDAAALLRTLTIVRNGGLRLSPYSPQSTQMLSTRLALGSVRLRVLRAWRRNAWTVQRSGSSKSTAPPFDNAETGAKLCHGIDAETIVCPKRQQIVVPAGILGEEGRPWKAEIVANEILATYAWQAHLNERSR